MSQASTPSGDMDLQAFTVRLTSCSSITHDVPQIDRQADTVSPLTMRQNSESRIHSPDLYSVDVDCATLTTTSHQPKRPRLAYDGSAGHENVVDSRRYERLPPGDSRAIALESATDLLASRSVVFAAVATRTDNDDSLGTVR